jgi:glycosyltransferase involved in cell wall biosynthesis
MQEPAIQIVLATYNGGKFLAEQLDSLFKQTFQAFSVLIRDDGSSDNTAEIIAGYQQRFPDRIQLVKDMKNNVGAAQNFGLLLEQSAADYIFFCDQDDVWLEDKMERSLETIKRLEKDGPTVPCMVFTDMKSIDEEGIVIADSVWRQLMLATGYFTLNRLLIQNIPHGCTMVINKSMRNLASPVPAEAILHDHWIALLAAACGKWAAIPEPTVLLRNHGSNVTRKQTGVADKLRRFIANAFSTDEYDYFIHIRVQQAKALLQRTAGLITAEQTQLLKDFSQLENTSGFSRKRIFIKHRFYRTTFLHSLKMILRA